MATILDYFKGEPRPQQQYVLREVERLWDNYDVFVVQAPTATGKSRIAHCIAKWSGQGTTILVPDNYLRHQYMNEFDDIITVEKRGDYPYGFNYDAYAKSMRGRDCVVNYHKQMQCLAFNKVVIVDEAHKMAPYLTGDDNVNIVYYEHNGIPEEIDTIDEIIEWYETDPVVQTLSKAKKTKLKKLMAQIHKPNSPYLPEIGHRMSHGKSKKCISLMPMSPGDAGKAYYWNERTTKKVVLMSATINEHDIEELGFAYKIRPTRIYGIRITQEIDSHAG